MIDSGSDPYYCAEFTRLFEIDKCVYPEDLCNGDADCPFGDDEWNCNDIDGVDCTIANGYFECSNSINSDYLDSTDDGLICIPLEWSCYASEYFWDCPNQEDVDPELCSTVDPEWDGMFCFVLCICICFKNVY